MSGLSPTLGSAVAQPPDQAILPVVVLVAVACGAVAVAANGLHLLAPALSLGDRALATRIGGAGAALVGLIWLVREARAIGGPRGQGPRSSMASLRTAATIMGALTVLALLNPPEAGPVDPMGGGGFGALGSNPFGDDLSGGEVLPAETRGGDSQIRGQEPPEIVAGPIPEMPDMAPGPFQRALQSSRWILLLALMMVVLRALTRNNRRVDDELKWDVPLTPVAAEAGLLASLDEVATGADDVGGRITRAYRRLLQALSEAGAPRESWEAPHEHLNRVLGPLGVPPDPLHALTSLYVMAHFSGRSVTDDHREQAVAALEESLLHVRAAEPLPESDAYEHEWAGSAR